MIAVDTSAMVAIILREPGANECTRVLASETEILISAGTVLEALIVATRRGIAEEMTSLMERIGFQVIPVTQAAARRMGQAYELWGKGMHPARLNFGDCFAYDVAQENACPLLFVGEDFAKTDVRRALT
jgi:ribonuclease VapC